MSDKKGIGVNSVVFFRYRANMAKVVNAKAKIDNAKVDKTRSRVGPALGRALLPSGGAKVDENGR